MSDTYKIRLTVEEICVLAAFAGYETVIGIDDDLLFTENRNLKEVIKETVKNLEKRELIRLDLAGGLSVKPEADLIVRLLCEPYFIGRFYSGNGNEVTVARRNESLLLLRKTENNTYEIPLANSADFLKFLIPESDKRETIEEELALSDIGVIRKKINSFDNGAVLKKLKERMHSEVSFSYIKALLSGRCSYLEAHIYKKNENFYENTYNAFLLFCEGLIFTVKNSGETVLFRTINREEIISEIMGNLKNKGAAVYE